MPPSTSRNVVPLKLVAKSSTLRSSSNDSPNHRRSRSPPVFISTHRRYSTTGGSDNTSHLSHSHRSQNRHPEDLYTEAGQNRPQDSSDSSQVGNPDNDNSSSFGNSAAIKTLCSIRMLTAVLCAAFIVSTAVCLLVTTFSFSMSAAQDIAERHAVAIATKAKTDVEELLNKPLASVAGWQYVFSKGEHKLPRDVDVANPDWYLRHWEDFVAAMTSTAFSYQFAVFGFDDGNYVGCKNTLSDQFQCRLFHWGSRPLNGSGLSTIYQRDYFRANYSLVRESYDVTNYDPRTRGWYKMVEHKPFAMEWSPVYLSAMPTLPLMDLNAAVYNASGALLGITSLAFELGSLSNFLADLVTTENTVSVLIDNEDLLLASSYSEPYLTSTNIPKPYTGEVPSNCLVSDSANDAALNIMLCRAPVASYSFAPLRQLARERPSLVKYGQSGALRLKLAEKDYFVSVVPVVTAQAAGMSWRFALFVPQNDIVGGIVRGRDVAIYIGIAIIVVAVALCFAVLTLLLSPLKDVTESMYRLATLQDTGSPSTPSRLHEIATIQGAFRVMSEELAKVKSFLPQSVLAQLYGAPSEEEEDLEEKIDQITSFTQSLGKNSKSGRLDALMTSDPNNISLSTNMTNAQVKRNGRWGADSSVRNDKISNPKAILNTGVSLANRKVSMLAVNIAAYHSHVVGADPSAVVAASAEVVAAVALAVNKNKGVLDGFQGDKFMASFNAVTSVSNHAAAAASAALSASSAISSIVVSSRPDATPLSMTGGIASGPAMVGNMGTQAVKRFTVLGHVVTTAGILERLCKRYPGARTLLAGNAITDTNNFFDLLICDMVSLPAPKGSQRTRIAYLTNTKNVGTDEWMYALADATKANKYHQANAAFEAFLQGEESRSHDFIDEALAHANDDDLPLRAVLESLSGLLDAGVDGRNYVNTQPEYFSVCIANPQQQQQQKLGNNFKLMLSSSS